MSHAGRHHSGSVPRRLWPRPLIFLHIPKAAGTSLQEVVVRQYAGGKCYRFTGDTQQWLDFPNLPEEERSSYDALIGHVHFGVHRFLLEPATYMTMLRDPIDRVVSHYYYVKSDPSHYLHERVVKHDYTLEEFAITRASHELDNDQVRWLTVKHHFEVPIGSVDRTLLEEAKWNLQHGIEVLGLTERFDESLLCFQKAFGWHDVTVRERKNVNAERPPLLQIEPEALEAIRITNRYDIELYEFAKALFEEQLFRLGVRAPGVSD